MKKFMLLLAVPLLFSFVKPIDTISEKERKDAAELIAKTEKGVFDAIKGLSEAQLKYKAAPDRWSIEECVIHIATTQGALWGAVDGAVKQPANPEKRADIKATDEGLIKMIEDRSNKVKTAPQLEPQNSSYKTLDEALKAIKENDEKMTAFVKTTKEDLRNHVVVLPFATFDSYQMILFIAGHGNRHTQQIEEVKADPGYPKK
ncbi:MAG: DinB family protein [Chitinophagaceae bacterium]